MASHRQIAPGDPLRSGGSVERDGLPVPQRYWAMLTLMTGLALSCLDTAIVNVALPTIARDLQASPANSIWIVNAYQLAVMISLLPFASFGDIFGYRRVYRFGLLLYTSAAVISATAHSLEILTLGRALQGLGAAGLMSVNTALVRFTYPRGRLGRGIALISMTVSTSSAAGPSVAAAVLSVAPWPFLFAVNIPIGVVTLLLSMRFLPYTTPSGHRFDLLSAVLCAVMFGIADHRYQQPGPWRGGAGGLAGVRDGRRGRLSSWCGGRSTTRCRCCRSTSFAGRSSRCR